jgi:serine/threonine-protein kinase HipA
MNRREILLAKDEGRRARKLYPWDFLQGVQDVTRQGALRFKLRGDQEFVAHDDLAAPPVTSLAELSDIATALTRTDIDDLDQLRRWLAALVAPGASLGGACPKANFMDEDNSVWIAKFPAHQDTRDVGGWEYLVWTMAQQAGIDTPPAKKKKIGQSGYHTFCVRRFDRVGKSRRFYASAMTMLSAKETADGSNSYLELAAFLSDYGDPDSIDTDLAQLFRRVVFNVIVGNRDDHLRNHGFLLDRRGWRLAPAFDMNPAIDKEEHVLNLDEFDNRPWLEHVRATASYYRLQSAEADQIIHEVVGVVKNWEELAKRHGLSSLERLEARRAIEAYRVDV